MVAVVKSYDKTGTSPRPMRLNARILLLILRWGTCTRNCQCNPVRDICWPRSLSKINIACFEVELEYVCNKENLDITRAYLASFVYAVPPVAASLK